MVANLSASVRRQCNCGTFLISALGIIWFAVGLGLIIYSANLGHELAACQLARFDEAQSSQTSPRPTSTKSAALSFSTSTHPSIPKHSTFGSSSAPSSNLGLASSSTSSSTSVPRSSAALASNPPSISASASTPTSLAALASSILFSAAEVTSSMSTSASTHYPNILDGFFSTLLGDNRRNAPLAPSPSPWVTTAAQASLKTTKRALKLGRQHQLATATADDPAATRTKVQEVPRRWRL